MQDSSRPSSDSDFQPFDPLPPQRRRASRRAREKNVVPSSPPPSGPKTKAQAPHSRRQSTTGLGTLLLVLLILTAVVLGGIGYQLYFRDRAVPGVRILGEDIGGMTREQVEDLVRAKFADPNEVLARYGGEAIVLRHGENVFRAWPWEIGLSSDLEPAIDAAFQYGHRDDWVLSAVEQVRALVLGADVTATAVFDEAAAREFVSVLAAKIDRPAREASFRLEGMNLVETPAERGRRLDGEHTFSQIKAYVYSPSQTGAEIELKVHDVEPVAVDAAPARKQLVNLLRAPLVLSFRERSWAIDQAALGAMLRLQLTTKADGSLVLRVVLNDEALRSRIDALKREINQAPRDARFHFDNGSLIPIIESEEGLALDVDATMRAIQTRLAQAGAAERTQGNAAPAVSPLEQLKANTVEVVVNVTKPEIDVRDMERMGIKELIATGTSNFKGSIPGRIQNIKTAAISFDGVVIPPGATFSFIKHLGEIVEANGYEDAYVIFGNRTVLGPGGGVCQVSTTMFRAAFFAGFPIVERWEHAYRVGYYEPPKGLDAAVFVPSADLKFVNDTPHYVLIEPVFDLKPTTLTFNFYGTKPNREVKMTEPEVTNKVPHPPALYIDDPNLPKGKTKQIDFAVDGEDVTLYREIYQDGKLVSREKFSSHYDPWQAVFKRGTKEGG